jgi:hypothetical protein
LDIFSFRRLDGLVVNSLHREGRKLGPQQFFPNDRLYVVASIKSATANEQVLDEHRMGKKSRAPSVKAQVAETKQNALGTLENRFLLHSHFFYSLFIFLVIFSIFFSFVVFYFVLHRLIFFGAFAD